MFRHLFALANVFTANRAKAAIDELDVLRESIIGKIEASVSAHTSAMSVLGKEVNDLQAHLSRLK